MMINKNPNVMHHLILILIWTFHQMILKYPQILTLVKVPFCLSWNSGVYLQIEFINKIIS